VSFVLPFLCSLRFRGENHGGSIAAVSTNDIPVSPKVRKSIRNAIYSTMRVENVITLRNFFYGRRAQIPGDKILYGVS
jgi:hypothetical protein